MAMQGILMSHIATSREKEKGINRRKKIERKK